VILLDLMMPVMDGWEFRRQQKADPELAPVP
jgi:CheY-like chemotaxis protein